MIREFDLDAPEAAKPKRIQFRDQTRCVTALVERCYKRSKETGKPWKILVEVVDRVVRPDCIDLLGVLTIQVPDDVESFLRLENAEKKPKTLDLLMTGVEKVAKARSLDLAPFESAAEEVRRLGFINEWVWKSRVANRSQTMFADIVVNHEIDAATLSARIRDPSGDLVGHFPLVSDRPNEFGFDKYFGTVAWLDDRTIELTSRAGEKRYLASVP